MNFYNERMTMRHRLRGLVRVTGFRVVRGEKYFRYHVLSGRDAVTKASGWCIGALLHQGSEAGHAN